MGVFEAFGAWWGFLVALVVLIAGHRLAWWLMLRDRTLSPERKLPRQLSLVALVVVGLIVLVLLLPSREGGLITERLKGDLLGLLGLAVTAILTLSSTTLAANAMAGLMLRMEHSFKPGDFVRVGESFGRVSERGLFHTEIQTEDRDLVTLPNLYLATNPVRVVRSSGTIVSADVSLGYDVAHARAEALLIGAAGAVGLAEPYVWITELRDHAVAYRVCGFLEDVRTLVSVRSRLRASVLDTLHGAGVEIVSPSYMAQRPAPREASVIPAPERRRASAGESAPEELVFDKAEAAELDEELAGERERLRGRLAELGRAAGGEDESARRESEEISARLSEIEAELETAKAQREGA